MSPEQALGQPTDARTDVFSLGAVLYEMATGRVAFQGPSSERTRHAILTADPISPRALNPGIPVALERIILRALQKERALRYQRAADLRADLQRWQKRATRQRRQAFSAAAIVMIGLFAGIAFWQSPYFLTQTSSDANVSVRQLTHNADELGVDSGVISADGQFVAFTDRTGIHVRTIETGETRTVPQSDRLPDIARWDLALGWFAETAVRRQSGCGRRCGGLDDVAGRSVRSAVDASRSWSGDLHIAGWIVDRIRHRR